MAGNKPGPDPIQLESKNCEYCGKSFNRKYYPSGLEDIRQYKNRRYCSRNCADEARRKKAREYYAKHGDEIREHKKKYMRERRLKNPERHNRQSREAKNRMREKLFNMYGHVCVICGFNDKRALTLDHIKNNGAEERKSIGPRGPWQRAIKKYRPSEYRILCMNCQFIERVKAKRENQFHSALQQHGRS